VAFFYSTILTLSWINRGKHMKCFHHGKGDRIGPLPIPNLYITYSKVQRKSIAKLRPQDTVTHYSSGTEGLKAKNNYLGQNRFTSTTTTTPLPQHTKPFGIQFPNLGLRDSYLNHGTPKMHARHGDSQRLYYERGSLWPPEAREI